MAQGRKSPFTISLNTDEKEKLEHLVSSTTIGAGLARRARIILLRAENLSLTEIARRVGVGRRIVRKWIKQFLKEKLPGLRDQPGRGRKPSFSPRSGYSPGQIGLRTTG